MNIAERLYASLKFRTTYNVTKLINTVVKIAVRPPAVKSIDETLDKIIRDKCSVSRYGSGEMDIMLGGGIGFQPANPELAYRLKEILIDERNENMMICLPDIFSSVERLTKPAANFWTYYLLETRLDWYRLINRDRIYYDAYMTRLYLDFADKSKCEDWFAKMKKIWHEREVVIVEGHQSRLGYGNNLFANAKSLVRILAPAEDAFARYQEVVAAVRKQAKSKLVLVALGPTATVLAYDLHQAGYQAIDIGHVDLEYEWFLRKATAKTKIPYKYVNEVKGGNQVEEPDDRKYRQEVVAVIHSV
ncbi:MAG: SP_1767 family glycosyltransferase [Anaerolineaceae bacterium]|nr:SP_1767 family glycosyltransferase [Anaerolineaceae bacterium]